MDTTKTEVKPEEDFIMFDIPKEGTCLGLCKALSLHKSLESANVYKNADVVPAAAAAKRFKKKHYSTTFYYH